MYYNLNVTIPQDFPPEYVFPVVGSAQYYTVPAERRTDSLGIIYTSSSSGGAIIKPVILYPWAVHNSTLSATETELDPLHYITIGETASLSIRARMPECYTSLSLIISLAQIKNTDIVSLDNATVVFIGEELYNSTLTSIDSKLIIIYCM